MPKKSSKYYVIIGCGRVGSSVASFTSAQGHNVVTIDINENSFKNLTLDYTGFTIAGDATEMDVLRMAKLDKADKLLALTSDDNTNFMVSVIGKYFFNVPQIIARIEEADNKEIFNKYSIETVCSFSLMIQNINNLIGSDS